MSNKADAAAILGFQLVINFVEELVEGGSFDRALAGRKIDFAVQLANSRAPELAEDLRALAEEARNRIISGRS